MARNPIPVTPQTLDQHDWLLYRHAALSRTYWWVEKDGERLSLLQPTHARLESDNYDLLLASALAGGGLFHVPLWSGAPYLADGRLVRLMEDYAIDPDAFGPKILAVYPSHRRATGKVLAFIEYLAAYPSARGWPSLRWSARWLRCARTHGHGCVPRPWPHTARRPPAPAGARVRSLRPRW